MRITLRTWVYARLERVWDVVTDSTRHPGKYLREVGEEKVVDRLQGGFIRDVTISGKSFTEDVSANAGDKEVLRQLLDHPVLSGQTRVRVVPCSVQNPMSPVDLQSFLDLQSKPGNGATASAEVEAFVRLLEEEQRQIKKKAEEMEQRPEPPK